MLLFEDTEDGGARDVSNGAGIAEQLLGLEGFGVLSVDENDANVVIAIETTVAFVGCSSRGVQAEAHDRAVVEIRDLVCFGLPALLVWSKRWWSCREVERSQKTWAADSHHVPARSVLTVSAGVEACPRSVSS